MNPFLSSSTIVGCPNSDINTLSALIRWQVEGMAVGDSKRVDLYNTKLTSYRAAIMTEKSVHLGRKFKTKTAKDGSLWIKRIS